MGLLIFGLVWLLLRAFETTQVYRRTYNLAETPAADGLKFEEIRFVAEDGVRLFGWWIPHEEAKGSVLFCHGNAGNIGDRVAMFRALHEMKVNVFAFDYRGYGQSGGWPTEKGTYRDARAAYEYVRTHYDNIEKPPIIGMGRSLGGGVVSQLALEAPLSGLVLESTFSSMVDMGKLVFPFLPAQIFCRNRYESINKVPALSMPALVAHSTEDDLIPYRMGKSLYDGLASENKSWIDLYGSHADAGWLTCPEYAEALEQFFSEVFR